MTEFESPMAIAGPKARGERRAVAWAPKPPKTRANKMRRTRMDSSHGQIMLEPVIDTIAVFFDYDLHLMYTSFWKSATYIVRCETAGLGDNWHL